MNSSLAKAEKDQQRTEGSFDFCKQSEATLALSGGSNLSVFVGPILLLARQYQLPTLPIIFLACSSTDDLKNSYVVGKKEYSFIGIRFYIQGRLANESMAREFSLFFTLVPIALLPNKPPSDA